jgi:PilZ domain
MAVTENSQLAIRRSTRLRLEVPVQVTSLGTGVPFSEQCHTTVVNAHGCGVISPRAIANGIQVRLEIVSAGRQTTARVSEVVPLGGNPETWLVGLELEVPGNFWGVEYAPSDWKAEEQETPQPIAPEGPKQSPAGRRWRLTDISEGACYLESATPLALGNPVIISVRTAEREYVLEGTVRASHPQTGMAIEFMRDPVQRQRVGELIGQLTRQHEAPRIFVGRKETQPAASTKDEGAGSGADASEDSDDSLLDLVHLGASLTAEQFLSNLRAQRLGKRREVRIEIAVPVLLTGTDIKGRPLDQRVMTVNISQRGAMLRGIHGMPSQGERISLARGSKKEEFLVAWVLDDKTAVESKIGVVALNPNTTFWVDVLHAASQVELEAASLLNGAGG